ncbi:helix-turn-helix domain-containing protein [Clostridium sp. Marseille-P2415]|uniref:helix-turn-helix domain-containing protein n=1 Tax=Clostridium sp. Marseille-P2415 TaxID=1805471 RepID=UPI0009885F7B|nr:AraC family transcriptional regulator [Clostridium sp. Marseille-P2415]
MDNYEKRGYLNSDFRLFHLVDTKRQDFEYHYHEFDKIIIFIRGAVTYRIEGCNYKLEPYDIILVSHNDIHKPDVDPSVPYERIIVYLSPGFLHAYRSDSYDLSACFQKSKELHSHVLRIHSMEKSSLYRTLSDLEYACTHDGYAKDLYCQVVFLEFMIQLNRASVTNRVKYLPPATGDRRILSIMDYINSHLTEDMTVDTIAEACYISRYHLMHLFKEETGYTLFDYITEKRLALARDLLKTGISVTEVCFGCGFKNYSTFSRAYKKQFHASPSETIKEHAKA